MHINSIQIKHNHRYMVTQKSCLSTITPQQKGVLKANQNNQKLHNYLTQIIQFETLWLWLKLRIARV